MSNLKINKKSKIYIAGSSGMVGSAVVRKLQAENYTNIVTSRSKNLDCRNQADVDSYFAKHKFDVVVIAAAKVGGILANNDFRGDFIYDNLQIQTNLIHSAKIHGVKKLIFLGSSCIYPKQAPQPIKEEYLLTSELEYTNEPYAIAKIAGLKMCESYFKQYESNFYSIMPCNLYGYNDNFDLKSSHVLPALIRKFHEAKVNNDDEVIMWGTGKPRREFMFVDDLADTIVHCIGNINASNVYDDKRSCVNFGSGKDVEIKELANLIKEVVGFQGKIKQDKTKPDGTMKKLMDVSFANSLGLFSKTSLNIGLQKTYNWFLNNN
jgi:GDP-L-fucose synthase